MFLNARNWVISLVTLYLLLTFSGNAVSQTTVTHLPEFDGELPFNLETGYIGVGDANDSQLFYYFVESQQNPVEDPFILWLARGPAWSGLYALLYENGPVEFDFTNYDGGMPSLRLNQYTWTQGLNMLYVDATVGTGYSYSTTPEVHTMNDEMFVQQIHQFLRRWMIAHPQYLENVLIIGGDGYSGIPLPIIVQEIINGNEVGEVPNLNINGYVLGNPNTDEFIDVNSRVPFAHRLTLISDQIYESLEGNCGDDYVNINASNKPCMIDIEAYDKMILDINLEHILEPNCHHITRRSNATTRSLYENYLNEILAPNISDNTLWCRQIYEFVPSAMWANDKRVREALSVSKNYQARVWSCCNRSLAYTKTISSSVDYHRNLSYTGLHVLIYSGDHDMLVSYIGTHNWIQSLNMTMSDAWRPWFLDGQIAGYTETFQDEGSTFVFATVKGAGHIASAYKGKECYEMIKRWLALYPL